MTASLALARLTLSLPLAFGLTATAACEVEQPEDAASMDDGDTETEDDAAPPSDDADPSGAGPAPTDAPPFDDDPATALGALAGMGFACWDAEDTRYNLLFDADRVTVRFDDGTLSVGSYEASAGALSLSFPELGFFEAATDAAITMDALVYFETPSLKCGAFAFDYAAPDEREIVGCPTVKYIPETSWEENEFQFGNGGYVLRRRWTELPMIPDTLYAERTGVYKVVGNRMFIALPFEDADEQWLTGTITDEGLFIDQLEPEQGACD